MRFRILKALVPIAIAIGTLTACSTPYGGASGCLVLGPGKCEATKENPPKP